MLYCLSKAHTQICTLKESFLARVVKEEHAVPLPVS